MGGAQQEKELGPAAPLPSGAGYIKTAPNPPGTGRWRPTSGLPGTRAVQQGETVTLEIVGVNGDEHPPNDPRPRGILHGQVRPDHPGPPHGQQAGPVPDNSPGTSPTCRAPWWSCPSSARRKEAPSTILKY